ncbi:MAG: nucleotidyltransferase family protein [Thermodesulfobacteriota bacterium]
MKRELSYFFVEPSLPVHKALERMGALNIVLVVDEECRLLGTLTDGDVRRALLERKPLDLPVEGFMNRNPITAPEGMTHEALLHLLLKRDVKQAPVVAPDGRVMDLVSLESLLQVERRDNTVFILAGGKGSRLYPLTKDVPKPMLTVGDKPILEIIVEQLRGMGFENIVMSVYYNKEYIIDHFGDGSRFDVRITYTTEDKPLGTAGPLACLKGKVDKPVLVMNGDLLSKINYGKLLDWHKDNGFVLTTGVRSMEFKIPFGVVEMDGACINSLQEKPTKEFRINAGVYVISPELLEGIPADIFYDMTELIADAITAGRKVGGYMVSDYWLDIGTRETYEQAQLEFCSHFKK